MTCDVAMRLRESTLLARMYGWERKTEETEHNTPFYTMALRRTMMSRVSVGLPGGDEIASQTMYRQLIDNRKRAPGRTGWTANRYMSWVACGGIVLSGAFVLGPWLLDETREMLGYNATIMEASTLAHTTPEWWENEWRKMGILWRKGEYSEGFFEEPYAYIKSIVGRDMAAEPRQRLAAVGGGASAGPSFGWARKLFGSSGARKQPSGLPEAAINNKPRALVPLCGDSPILKVLVRQGYQVDGVDCSETAIRTCVEKMEMQLNRSEFQGLTLHYKDIFSPSLWNKDIAGRTYDFVYDRQALSAINPEQRPDYAFLLKQALKDDGILYVEGVFRTGRVKGNKVRGPPFGLSRAQLRDLFPEREGFFVQCKDTEDNATKLLDIESKVLRRVPKALHVTTFPCVVFKEGSIGVPPTPLLA